MEYRFTKNVTNFIKGIAVYLLLWHHLFYNSNYIESFNTKNIPEIVSYYSKVCVAIFTILSGYGLSESWKVNKYPVSQFYKKNFKKLYSNYWLIWALFVPIGVIFFNRSFSDVYNDKIFLKLIMNIFGLQKLFSFHGYNATWWYMSLILGLYLIFPLLYKLVKKHPFLTLCLSFLIMSVPAYKIGNFNPKGVYGLWIFPFTVGIFLSHSNLLTHMVNCKFFNKIFKLVCYFIIMIILMYFRRYGLILVNEKIDTLLGMVIILICFEYLYKIKYFKDATILVGNNSFNIFLFHTFIYEYYFNDFIYSFNNPILIFLVLLIICLIVSIIIEKLKYQISIFKK